MTETKAGALPAKTVGLTIEEALAALKAGKKIRRGVWQKGTHLYSHGSFIMECHADESCDSGFINGLFTADWEIIQEAPRLMPFEEALKHLKAREKVSRLAWKEERELSYLELSKDSFFFTWRTSQGRFISHHYILSRSDCEAADWYIVEQEAE